MSWDGQHSVKSKAQRYKYATLCWCKAVPLCLPYHLSTYGTKRVLAFDVRTKDTLSNSIRAAAVGTRVLDPPKSMQGGAG